MLAMSLPKILLNTFKLISGHPRGFARMGKGICLHYHSQTMLNHSGCVESFCENWKNLWLYHFFFDSQLLRSITYQSVPFNRIWPPRPLRVCWTRSYDIDNPSRNKASTKTDDPVKWAFLEIAGEEYCQYWLTSTFHRIVEHMLARGQGRLTNDVIIFTSAT